MHGFPPHEPPHNSWRRPSQNAGFVMRCGGHPSATAISIDLCGQLSVLSFCCPVSWCDLFRPHSSRKSISSCMAGIRSGCGERPADLNYRRAHDPKEESLSFQKQCPGDRKPGAKIEEGCDPTVSPLG